MRIAILSRKKTLYSIKRLIQEASRARIQCDVINPLNCQLIIDNKVSKVFVQMKPLPTYQAIIPRIGASITEYGLSVVRQFENQGSMLINSSQAIAESRNKMRSLQIMTNAGILVPSTILTRNIRSLKTAIQTVKGLPAILKLTQGTQGIGVMLIHTLSSFTSIFDTLQNLGQDALLQQYLTEGAGRDYRAFVVGKEVIATMLRTAPQGEFRSNIHRGGEGTSVKLPPVYVKTALRAARALGLDIAGVDLMESSYGPMVIEVNSSPGFEGIEKATGLNIARSIIQYIKKRIAGSAAQ